MRVICLLFITSFFFLACSSSRKIETHPVQLSDNIIVAHRGAWKKNNFPQNSIASLLQSIQLKCAGSEFDVRMTADDSLVINHDVAYHQLVIEKTNYADLITFKLSNGEKIPTLREYILAGMSNNSNTSLVCEIKPSEISKERGKIVAAKVVALFQQLKAERLVVYISFDYEILKKIIEIDPKATTQYLSGDKSPQQLKVDGVSGADYQFPVFQKNPEWIESAKQLHIILNAWTVNEASDMDWLLAKKFDFITTNEPELLSHQMKLSLLPSKWKLVWSDEFNYKGLPDSSKWGYDIGGHGWGNSELQYYTNKDTSNVSVDNGVLKITARKQIRESNAYTSARLQTNGKVDFKYGKIEVRAKLPGGRGTWPAIWMLGNNIQQAGWPICGEIDIMEHVGFQKDSIFGTIHTNAYNHIKGTQKMKGIFISSPYNQFHNYSIEWSPEKIDFLMDGLVYNHFANEHLSTNEWAFDQPFHLLLNVAIGGGWGGKMGVDDTIFPVTMEVDYVRHFQLAE